MTRAEIVNKVGMIDYLDDASPEALELYREILDSGSIHLIRACLRMAHFAGHRDASKVMQSRASSMMDNSGALMDLTATMFDS